MQNIDKPAFLADMNISPHTVKELRNHGWKIILVSEVLDSRTKDVDILAYARNENLVLITQDLDFSVLLAIGGYEKPSVISLRLDNPDTQLVTHRILAVVAALSDQLLSGAIVSVDEYSARYRLLPLKVG